MSRETIWDEKIVAEYELTEIGGAGEGVLFRENGVWKRDETDENVECWAAMKAVLDSLSPDTLVLIVAMNRYDTALFTGKRENMLRFVSEKIAADYDRPDDVERMKEVYNWPGVSRDCLEADGAYIYDEVAIALDTAREFLTA